MYDLQGNVEDNMGYCLLAYLEWEEIEEAMPVIVKELSDLDYLTLEYKHTPGKTIPMKDCWDKNIDQFTILSLDNLWRLVRDHAFTWCIQKMRSMK
jgi:hypothetical protein